MSLLQGLGMGLAGAGASVAAYKEADRRDRQLAINEAEEARRRVAERERIDEESANATMTLIDNGGFFNDTKTRIDGKKLAAGLEANDAQARSVALGIARSNGLIDPSVKDARWVKGPNGEWVIQTSNEDGTFGVITVDGSNDPNAPVASFKTLEEFVDVTNEALADTLRYQTKFDNAAALAAEGIVLTDYNAVKQSIEQLPPEQQVATSRGVIAGAANIKDPAERQQFVDAVASGEPPPEPEPPAPETPAPQEEPPAPRSGVRGPLEIMGETEQRGLAARRQKELPEKKAQLKEAEARVSRLEEEGTSGRALRAAKTRRDNLRNEIAELEPATFTMDTPEQQASVDKVVEETKDMPTEQVVEKVMSGEITMSPEEQAVVATQLQQAGVETVNDLAKLENRKDRAMARVAMIAAIGGTSNGRSPDLATQRAMLGQITNIFETGTASMSAKDSATLGIQQQNANLRAAEFERALYNDRRDAVQLAATAGSEMLKEWGKIKEEEGDSFEAAMRFLNTQAAPFINEYRNKPKWLQKAYKDALNPVVSEILAAYAAKEEGGLAESFYSLFRDDIDRENVSKTDFDLNRVKGDFTIGEDGEVKIKGFWFTDQDGDEMDESVPAKVLLDLDKTLYDILLLAAVSNRTSGGED